MPKHKRKLFKGGKRRAHPPIAGDRDVVAQQLVDASLAVHDILQTLLIDVIAYVMKATKFPELAAREDDLETTLQEVVALRLMSAGIYNRIARLTSDRPVGMDTPSFPRLVALARTLFEIEEREGASPMMALMERSITEVRDRLRQEERLLLATAIRPDQLLSSRLPVHLSDYIPATLKLVEAFSEVFILPRPRFELSWNGDVRDLREMLMGIARDTDEAADTSEGSRPASTS